MKYVSKYECVLNINFALINVDTHLEMTVNCDTKQKPEMLSLSHPYSNKLIITRLMK